MACCNISPEIRVSRPTITTGFLSDSAWRVKIAPPVRPKRNANSGVNVSLAMPRTPSVPKYFNLISDIFLSYFLYLLLEFALLLLLLLLDELVDSLADEPPLFVLLPLCVTLAVTIGES